MKFQYKIFTVAETYRGINIYHAVGKTEVGFRITSTISERLFPTVDAAKEAIMAHDTKLGYGKVER